MSDRFAIMLGSGETDKRGNVQQGNGDSKGAAERLLPVSGIAALIILWELTTRLNLVDNQFLPRFSLVFEVLVKMLADGSMASHFLVSSFRGILGFIVAVTLAIPLGLLIGYVFPSWYPVLEPSLRIGSQVNPFALMSVFLLFFGDGEAVKIVAVAWVAFWPVLFYSITGVSTVDPVLIRCAKSHCAPSATIALKVVLPAALPTAFVGIRISTGLVFFMLVAAEMLGASKGLGWFVHSSGMNYQVVGIYAGAISVIVLGYSLNRLVKYLENQRAYESRQDNQGDAKKSNAREFFRTVFQRQYVIPVIIVALLILGGREAIRADADSRAAMKGERQRN